MRHILYLFVLLFSLQTLSLQAQDDIGSYNIDIKVNNYPNDTLLVGYYYGDRQLVRDTLFSTKTGEFTFTGTDTLDNGVYLLLTYPDNQYIQFHVNEGDKEFEIEFDYADKKFTQFKNSEDNENFQSYVTLLNKYRPQAVKLRDTIKSLKEKELPTDKFQEELNKIDEIIVKEQKRIIELNPDALSAIILKASEDIDVPSFEGEEDIQIKRYTYFKKHYFDNIDLENPVVHRAGVLTPKVDYFIEKLTVNHPDSISESLDLLLDKMEPAEETYRYYLSTFLNKYAKSKVIGYDGIYVHLVKKYYQGGKAPWINEESLAKIVDNAKKLEPVLIGKTGADIKVFKEDGSPISISDIDYEYLVLLFWAPDCGHCTKMMPHFVEFNEKWKDTGVKLFAICTKHQDKTKTCWDNLEKKDMLGFINAADQFHQSRFKLKYNVATTPKVFILDKDREILIKNIGGDQIDQVMQEILKRAGKEELIPADPAQ